MSIYQLDVFSRLTGGGVSNPSVNVFNYRSTVVDPAPPATALGLVSGWATTVLPLYQAVISSLAEVFLIRATNVYDPTDFFESTGVFVGTPAGEVMPRFVSFNFESVRLSVGRHMRARKAIPFVPEGSVTNGSPSAGALTSLANLGAGMSEEFEDPDNTNATYIPILVHKQKYAVPGSDPVRFAYEYYDTEEDQLLHINTITAYAAATVSSQNSRKR